MHNIRFIQTCLITLLLLIAACTQQHQDGSQTIRVNVDEDLPADSFISQYSFIQLDSVTSPMVSQVRDIRLLDSLIFILDDAGRIFTFSSEGRHLATLDSLGMGSGQYATADAFDITKAGIYVLSRPQERIMQYSFDGTHLPCARLLSGLPRTGRLNGGTGLGQLQQPIGQLHRHGDEHPEVQARG